MILTVFNQKGGVGKSTLAVCLADVFNNSAPTCLIDLDKQGTISHLGNLPDFPLSIRQIEQIEDLQNLEEKIKIVDCPPYYHSDTARLFAISDFILIPTKAGYSDFFSLSDTADKIKQSGTKAGVVINMIKARSGLTHEVEPLIEKLELTVLRTQIRDRVGYGRALVMGSVYGLDKKAAHEITELTNEIMIQLTH